MQKERAEPVSSILGRRIAIAWLRAKRCADLIPAAGFGLDGLGRLGARAAAGHRRGWLPAAGLAGLGLNWPLRARFVAASGLGRTTRHA